MNKMFKRVLALAVVLCMVIGSVPMAFADDAFVSETHKVFSSTESTIAPGVTQSIKYAYANDGKQMVYYVATADISRDDVVVQTSYYKQHEGGIMGMATMGDQMAYAQQKYTNPEDPHFVSEYYTPVVGVNASFFNMSTGQPLGVSYIDGVSFGTASYDNFFAILADGTAVIDYRTSEKNYTGDKAIVHAVAGSQWLVRDGKDVTANVTGSYNTERHCRTCVGITADGKVVTMVLDGRQEPFSCGGTMHELAQIMLEAGCVAAVNLDGGGSTTYMSRPEGENKVQVVNRPSDGSPRAVSAGLIIASTAAPSDVFDRATLKAENEYVTPYSTVKVTAAGVSPAGTAAEIPENAQWQLEDSALGTVENGVFTANGNVGTAVVQLTVDGKVVGETEINVVIPELKFDSEAMTVPYGKTFNLKVSGTTNGGMNKVVLKASDLVFEFSNPAMGSINGIAYTTCGAESGLTGGTITVKCAYDATKTASTVVTFGRASVIAEDFEDGVAEGWSAKSGYARSGNHLIFGRFESYDLGIVTKETGKVRNGDYAMKLVADFSTGSAAGYKCIKYSFPAIDLTGATSFGMWMYIPVVDVHYLEFDIGSYEYYIEDDANITEEGWYYISAPVKSVGSSVSSFNIYMTDPDETYPNTFSDFSIYIDDLTIDYSNATDDREIPKFNKVTIVTDLDQEKLLEGQTYNGNVLNVKAYAAEDLTGNYTGLDLDSARVYVDGVALTSGYSCDESGVITVSDIVLGDGVHTFRFEIDDNAGNTGFVTRQVVVNTDDSDIKLVYNPSIAQPLAGSVEYLDIVAKNIEKVDALSLTIDLDTLTEWELQGADVAYGFEMTYSVEDRSHTATITIVKTGACELSGEAVLAKLPVRVWATDSHLNEAFIAENAVSNDPAANEKLFVKTPAAMWQTDNTRIVRMEIELESAVATYADGSTATFAGKEIIVVTENNRYRSNGYITAEGKYITCSAEECEQGKLSTHVHVAGEAQDKAATCTEAGYIGRVFCVDCECGAKKYLNSATEDVVCKDHVGGCASVIDWGTIVPATGHNYTVVDGVLTCDCGSIFSGVYTDGKTYVDGVVLSGWVGDSYYVDGVMLTGVQLVDGLYYDFGANGVSKGLANGLFEMNGDVFMAAAGELKTGWQIPKYVDGVEQWYYFNPVTGAAVDGEQTIDSFKFVFENNVLVKGQWYTHNGKNYYRWGRGNRSNEWFVDNGKTYWFWGGGDAATGIVSRNHFDGVSGEKKFAFDLTTGEWLENYTGLFNVGNDTYYVKDGFAIYAGLVKVGDDYYYFNSSLKAVKNRSYYITEDNGLGYKGTQTFDADGKMIIESDPVIPEEPTVKNGIVTENGVMYYYVNDVKTYAGLVKIGEDYYYVKSNAQVVVGTSYYISKDNGLGFTGRQEFGADGKMIIVTEPETPEEPTVKNGIVTENGAMYYYVDGVKTYAGLIKIGEDYYYVKSNAQVVAGTSYYISKDNGLGFTGRQEFGADGKMVINTAPETPDVPAVKNGIVTEGGKMFYYVDGVKTYAGLIKIGEDYYYVKSNAQVVTGTSYYISKDNGLGFTGRYEFGADGKMIID